MRQPRGKIANALNRGHQPAVDLDQREHLRIADLP
jgi:hypothetical protein